MEVTPVNTEEIMNQIRENIKTRGYSELELKFADVSAGNYVKNEIIDFNFDELSNEVYSVNSTYGVDYLQPMDGGGIKLFLKRVIRKVCKPAVAPMVERQNLFNGSVARALSQITAYISEQNEDSASPKTIKNEKQFMDAQEKLTEDLDTRVILLEKRILELENKINELEDRK